MWRTMYLLFLILLIKQATISECNGTPGVRKSRQFPDGFLFGTATASYQVEGAWDEDGKSENIWDHLTHTNPCAIKDCSSGDIADDSYHQIERDVEMMRELGLDFYRFSLSWSRILPTSFPNEINEAGVAYYNKLINEMLKYNIEPMVTLYHWDLPQKLQELGGWANPHIGDWFGDYARTAFTLFGDRVKYWITINEPREICYQGYGSDTKAPRLNIKGIGEYLCAKNLLLAHAKAYHIYDEEFRQLSNGGIIGITLSAHWYEPESEKHAEAAEDANQFHWGQYAHPIFSENGDFPVIMKERVATKSAAQGFSRSRLPEFTPEEVNYVRGSSDFFGLNHYTSNLVYRNESVSEINESPSLNDDIDAVTYQPSYWEGAASNWLKVAPWGFVKLLRQIKEVYNNPPVYITENGFSTFGGLVDDDRINYYRQYLNALLDAIKTGSNVQAYAAWSLMDNFEWMEGYTILLIFCTALNDCKVYNPKSYIRSFPEGFKFGTATASYQVEGAWNEDGKSENIWDHETHIVPSPVEDQSTGDIADDSYHQYKRDVEMMRELGLDHYRFSISWTRIMPSSFPDQINEAGVAYYNNLINEMLKYDIEPMVTLYHWDLPQRLQDLGGLSNPYLVDWFADYARTVFRLYGDRVKIWITFNEPLIICYFGYGSDKMAPRLNFTGIAEYMCTKNILMAHAKAYHIYNEEFKPSLGGVIGITLSAQWYEPDSEEQIVTAEDANAFDWGIFANPIFSESGDYPAVVKKRTAARSKEQGFPRSRLDEFTPQEVDYVRGTADFLGINHYSSYLVYRNASVNGYYPIPSYEDDLGAIRYQKNEWKIGESSMVMYAPWGFYKLLKKIKEYYNNPPIFITENGFASYGGLQDDDRILYYRGYLDAVLDALDEGSDIRCYTAWSLMDNFEWLHGYTERFGLYEVNYNSSERVRTPRKSAFVYKEIIRTRKLDWNYEPNTNVNMTIDENH